MRGIVVLGVLGMSFTTVHADPFGVRNPVPDAPPSAVPDPSPRESDAKVEILDPGYSQRRNGTLVTAAGTVVIGASAVLSFTMKSRYDAALARLEAGDDPYRATDDANHARRVAQVWGTTLFATGVVAVGVGAYLYFTAPLKIRREHVVVVPAVDRDGVGFAVSGGF